MKNLIKLIIFVFAFQSCTTDTAYQIPNYTCVDPALVANKTIPDVVSNATKNPTLYVADDIIEAYVTSSDKEGNFYKTISFQNKDKTIGFSIAVDDTNLYLNYEPGRKVYIKLRNNYTDLYYNSLRIGSLYVYPDSRSASIGRLSLFDYSKIAVRSCTTIAESELISEISIDQITDNHLNRLLTLKNIQFTTDSHGRSLYESSLDIGGATNHLISDGSGKKLIVRISSYCNFSEEKVPTQQGSITGVLTKYKNDYQLMPRYYRDLGF